MSKTLILTLTLLAVGCLPTDPQVRLITAVTLACDSYTSTLSVLADRRAQRKLSASQVRKVDAVRVIANQPCSPGAEPPTDGGIVRELTDGVADLVRMKTETR